MENNFNGGWIYVVMTSSDYNRFKLGRTIGNPISRFKTLRTGDPRLGIEVAYFIPASFAEKLSRMEADLRRELGPRISFHDENGSEWHRGSAKDAAQLVECLLEGWSDQPIASIHLFGKNRICRAYEEDLATLYGPAPLLDDNGIPW